MHQRKYALLLAACLTASCASFPRHTDVATRESHSCGNASNCTGAVTSPDLAKAKWAANRARLLRNERSASMWTQCALEAYRAAGVDSALVASVARSTATTCADELLKSLLKGKSRDLSGGRIRLSGIDLSVEFRRFTDTLTAPVSVQRAKDVSVALYGGQRYLKPGFGVPLALVGKRCVDTALCDLLPLEGVFRSGTAWIEPSRDLQNQHPVLVISNPLSDGQTLLGKTPVPLALDTSAAYAYGVRRTRLRRLAIWGLVGGTEIGRRSGIYLLEDYDPGKRPIVMIHGLGSSPLAWAKLTNAVWAEPELRSRYQVWHVVYQTDAPLLVTRLRIESFLNQAWEVLDPEGDDSARHGIVLVGHSMGGVLARLLTAESKSVLWYAAFKVDLDEFEGDSSDNALVKSIFRFSSYPGISSAIFLASPHRGSPSADAWFGRLAQGLVRRRSPEIQSLKRFAKANPLAVKEELLGVYQKASLNSISTLRPSQPVSRAGEALMPVSGVSYYVISGVLANRHPLTDGVVPLASTLLPGAAKTLTIRSGHDVYNNDQALAEVVRILGTISPLKGISP